MNKLEYYTRLMNSYRQLNEVQDPVKTAETGADVNEAGLDQGNEAQDMQMDQNQELQGDANYMNQEQGDPSQSEQSVIAPDQIRKKKLFDLLYAILRYGRNFLDQIHQLDTDMLDDDVAFKLTALKPKISRTNEKIARYIEDSFVNDTYERCMYIFILLRTELLSEIEDLRHIVGIDHPDNDK